MTARRLALPLTVIEGAGLATVIQDSALEVGQSVALLLTTRPGERASVPDYGTPDPLFGGVDPGDITEAIAIWEERALSEAEKYAAGVIDRATVTTESVTPRTTTGEEADD